MIAGTTVVCKIRMMMDHIERKNSISLGTNKGQQKCCLHYRNTVRSNMFHWICISGVECIYIIALQDCLPFTGTISDSEVG